MSCITRLVRDTNQLANGPHRHFVRVFFKTQGVYFFRGWGVTTRPFGERKRGDALYFF